MAVAPYVYQITVTPIRWSHTRRRRATYRWLVALHWSHDLTTSYATHRSKISATALAHYLARQRLREQGDNKRLSVVVHHIEGTTVTETAYAHDPRSRA